MGGCPRLGNRNKRYSNITGERNRKRSNYFWNDMYHGIFIPLQQTSIFLISIVHFILKKNDYIKEIIFQKDKKTPYLLFFMKPIPSMSVLITEIKEVNM